MCLGVVEQGGASGANVSAHVLAQLVGGLACTAGGHSGLHHEHSLLEVADHRLLVSSVRVRVQSEDLRIFFERKALDVVAASLETAVRRVVVGVKLRLSLDSL